MNALNQYKGQARMNDILIPGGKATALAWIQSLSDERYIDLMSDLELAIEALQQEAIAL